MNNNSFAAYNPLRFRNFSLYSSQIYRWEVKILTNLVLVMLVSKALLSGALFLIPSTNAASPLLDAPTLIQLTNTERKINGRSMLRVNTKLAKAAEKKANDIMARGYFSHTTPEGKPFYQWIQEANYTYKSAGENLAISFISNEDATAAWMKSTTHRENILDPHYTDIGIAVAIGEFEGKTTAVAVQMFGEPTADEAIMATAIGSPIALGAAIESAREPGGAVVAPETIRMLRAVNSVATASLIVLFALAGALIIHDIFQKPRLIFKSTSVRSSPAEPAHLQ